MSFGTSFTLSASFFANAGDSFVNQIFQFVCHWHVGEGFLRTSMMVLSNRGHLTASLHGLRKCAFLGHGLIGHLIPSNKILAVHFKCSLPYGIPTAPPVAVNSKALSAVTFGPRRIARHATNCDKLVSFLPFFNQRSFSLILNMHFRGVLNLKLLWRVNSGDHIKNP